jgi:serine/threonine protein kinase
MPKEVAMVLNGPARLIDSLRRLPLLPSAQCQVLDDLAARYPDDKALAAELVGRGWLTEFQVRELLAGRGSRLVLGPYLILERLGQGGMGQVFKARHLKMGRLVALKLLRRELRADAESVQRFHREVEAIAQCSHPNIVHAFEAGDIGPVFGLVMEYVQGTSLEDCVKARGPLPVQDACSYARQTALALQCIHERGLVHRDIKPSNLLLTDSGVVKLLDLGLARFQDPPAASATAQLTVLGGKGVTQGTPDYLSPEQALDFHNADIRSDLYALGCTLHFLLTGRPPFAAHSLAETLLRHQQADPPALDRERPDVPAALAAVVARLLAKRPADRYQQPADVVSALDQVLGGRSSSAPLVKPGGRRRRPVAYAAAALAATALAVMGAFLLPSGDSPSSLISKIPSATLLASRPSGGMLPAGPALLRGPESGRPFRGGEDAVEIPHDPALDPPELTVATWLYLPNLPDARGIPVRWVLSKGSLFSPGQYGLLIDRDRAAAVITMSSDRKETRAMSARGSLTNNHWHHLAMTFDGEVLRCYLDGTLAAETAVGQRRPSCPQPLAIGRQVGSHGATRYVGRLDDVRIYNRALSAAEIQDHFQNPAYPIRSNEKGLVGAWLGPPE